MRSGGEYFSEPAEAAQRRYEALRYYFVEEARAEQVAARFGYSPATVHQLAAELRAGRTSFFRSTKPGPKGPRKTRTVRDRVLVLRAEDQSVTEIANALTAQGSPVSAQTVWAILKSEGLERLEPVSYTHLRAHETVLDLVCRLLLEKKKKKNTNNILSL